jgi:hypothetical protein
MGKTKLIDLSARDEKVSSLDKNKEKTKWVIGPLSARQLFLLYSKHEAGTRALANNKATAAGMAAGAMLAYDFARFGLKEVKGELGKGFELKETDELGFECKAVSPDYLDVLPMEILMEVGSWVGEYSQAGTEQKKG